MEGFKDWCEDILRLAMPNQYCTTVRMQLILRWFRSNILGQNPPDPYIEATVLL